MEQYCIYLRKSRSDAEAEARGEGETLARHEKALLELAKRQRLTIIQVYREVVSGETIAARPVMQKLLAEVEQGIWSGVLVMEVERLARGDTMDQGFVAQAFKYSDTKIITPMKTYDPNNEFDEEYFEFGLFMSRREYKTINRRLQRGRAASAREGKYVASKSPYGYERVKISNDKGYTLKPVPDEAEIVKMIFSLYVNGEADESGARKRLGIQLIAGKLNSMHIPPIRHDYWQKATIRDILINPVYIGKIRWNWRPHKKKVVDGKRVSERPRNHSEDCILAEGLHPAIISEEVFEAAQKYMEENPPPPIGYKNSVKNPFAGIIICGKCGRRMVFRSGANIKKKNYIVCHARFCDNISSPFHYIEERILSALQEWLGDYRLKWETGKRDEDESLSLLNTAVKILETKITTLEKQLNNTYDFHEQGVYTTEEFLKRSRSIAERVANARKEYDEVKSKISQEIIRDESRQTIIPKIEHLLNVYHNLPTPADKNDLIKEVLEKVVYTKTVNGSFRGASADGFEIVLYPKLPKSREST